MTLRPHQDRSVTQLRQAYAQGSRAPLLVLPTGGGKTAVASYIVRSHLDKVQDGACLWVAHRRELVDQATRSLAGVGAPLHRIEVASVQALLAGERRPDVSLVVLDEAHHYVAREWRTLAEHYAGAIRLGLTATPERSDGTAMGDIFDSLVVGATVRELTDAGWLVPCDILSPAKKQRKAVACDGPVAAYAKHCAEKRTVVYCSNVEHAEQTDAEFREAGIEAPCIDGSTPPDERATALARFAAGEISVLCNVYVLTEGWDCPSTECVILARGVGHTGMAFQIVGRALRPSPETGKTRATVVDLCGSFLSLPLPTDPVEYSLEGRAIRKVKGLPALKQCRQCGAVYRPGTARECPRCGFVLPAFVPKKTREELQAIARNRDAPDARRMFLKRMQALAAARRFKPGWAYRQYVARYGVRP